MAICGCTTTGSDGRSVKHVEQNIYEVTTHTIGDFGGFQGAEQEDEKIALKFCADKGRKMTVVSHRGYGGVSAQDVLTFRCGDSVVAQPKTDKPAKKS